MTEDDDPFWACYSADSRESPEFLAAHGRNDDLNNTEERHWSGDKQEWMLSVGTNLVEQHPHELHVIVQETRGEGVLDAIGGELWEASLLMCADIVVNHTLYIKGDSLEVGAGVGLPSLLLAKMKAIHNESGSICLTDYDHRVLMNLSDTVPLLCDDECVDGVHLVQQDKGDKTGDNNKAVVNITVEKLDWFEPESFSDLPLRFDIMYGAALVYNPDHACLADICRDALHHPLEKHGRCHTITIFQIKDRPGFSRFLDRLALHGICFTVEALSTDIWALAKRITAESVVLQNDGVDAGSIGRGPEVFQRRVVKIPLTLSDDKGGHEKPAQLPLLTTDPSSFVKVSMRRQECC